MDNTADDYSGLQAVGDGSGGPLSPVPASDSPPPGRPAARREGSTRGGRGGNAGEDPEADPDSVARAIILRQLTGSAKSRKQLADKLAERQVPSDAAARVLDRFEELKLVDDAAFADAWVRSRTRTRGLARGALRRELREKGIGDDLADDALEQVSADDELMMARELVEKKARSLPASLDHDKGVRRLVAMLGRKGYDPGIAFRVVNEVWLEESP